jgi:anti-sigma factor RsiW
MNTAGAPGASGGAEGTPASPADELECQEVVEVVTDYLEGALPLADRIRFEQHLAFCQGCVDYLEQLRTTIRLTGTLTPDAVPAPAMEALLDAFRTWRRP